MTNIENTEPEKKENLSRFRNSKILSPEMIAELEEIENKLNSINPSILFLKAFISVLNKFLDDFDYYYGSFLNSQHNISTYNLIKYIFGITYDHHYAEPSEAKLYLNKFIHYPNLYKVNYSKDLFGMILKRAEKELTQDERLSTNFEYGSPLEFNIHSICESLDKNLFSNSRSNIQLILPETNEPKFVLIAYLRFFADIIEWQNEESKPKEPQLPAPIPIVTPRPIDHQVTESLSLFLSSLRVLHPELFNDFNKIGFRRKIKSRVARVLELSRLPSWGKPSRPTESLFEILEELYAYVSYIQEMYQLTKDSEVKSKYSEILDSISKIMSLVEHEAMKINTSLKYPEVREELLGLNLASILQQLTENRVSGLLASDERVAIFNGIDYNGDGPAAERSLDAKFTELEGHQVDAVGVQVENPEIIEVEPTIAELNSFRK